MRSTIATVLATFVLSSQACQPSGGFLMTFYGWPDNSPPGNKVAMNCGGRNGAASGNGTYDNPLTMAAEKGRFANCELVYSPFLKKYLRMEDTCANCNGDWVDIWTGSTTSSGGSALSKCQQTLTGANTASHVIITAPPTGLDVNDGELFENGACCIQNIYAAADANPSCAPGTGSVSTPTLPSTSGAPLPVSPVAASTDPEPSEAGKSKNRSWKGRHGRHSRHQDR